MPDDSGWGTIVGGGLGATGVAFVFGLWDRYFRRKEKVEDSEKDDRDHMRTYLDARGQAALDRMDRDLARANEALDRERARNIALEAVKDACECDKDRAWDTAREWKVRCHDVKHELDNARTMVNATRAAAGQAAVQWFDETLPPIDGILEDNRRRGVEREKWRGQARLAEP